jgi:TolB-like protein
LDHTEAFVDAGDITPALLRRPLVAVLPFGSVDGDASLALLGSELAEMVRERLAGVPELRAILISSAFLERAPEHALDLICRQLHVGRLVTGRCHRAATGASLFVEVSETREGKVLWASFLRGTAHELLAPDSAQMERLHVGLAQALRPQSPPPALV